MDVFLEEQRLKKLREDSVIGKGLQKDLECRNSDERQLDFGIYSLNNSIDQILSIFEENPEDENALFENFVIFYVELTGFIGYIEIFISKYQYIPATTFRNSNIHDKFLNLLHYNLPISIINQI